MKTTLVLQDFVNVKFLNLDPVTRKKFHAALKFDVPHARHTPQFKLKRWDGKVAFGGLSGTTFINCLELVLPIIEKAGYEIEIEDKRPEYSFDFPEIDEDFVADRCWPLGHERAGQPIVLRDYQVDAINRFFENPQSLQVLSTGAGKAQPLWSKIKTPNGWITMAEAAIGTVLSMPDGDTARIAGVFPQGRKAIYKLTFKDGRTAEACGDHLWKTHCLDFGKQTNGKRNDNHWKIITTDQIRDRLIRTKRPVKIPLLNHTFDRQPAACLPLDPYVLGVLIGDGGLKNSVTISTADKEILDRVSSKLISGYEIRHAANYDYRITMTHAHYKEIRPIISNTKNIGLVDSWNHYKCILSEIGMCVGSDEKFIPPEYIYNANVEQRLELIRGLIDTDGHVGKNGNISFTSTSQQLAEDFSTLIRSIGGIAKITSRFTKYTHNGEIRTGKKSHTVHIRYHDPKSLMTLSRKKNRVSDDYQYGKNLLLEIVSIDYIGDFPCQCIMVDHPEHLYITDNYIVTHNTILTACLSLAVEKYGRSIVIVPSKDLVKQTEADYINLGLDVGVYYGDRKEWNKQHTICTWQSLVALDKKEDQEVSLEIFLEGVVCVMVDECHGIRGNLLKEMLCGIMGNIPIRWGFTGTIPKEEYAFMSLLVSIGPVVGEIKALELQDRGVLANCEVQILQLQDDHVDFADYDTEQAFITTDITRLTWTANYCSLLAESGNTLILVGKRKTGLALEKLIPDSVFLYGITKSNVRQEEYKSVQTATNKIIIATYGIASTGINIPRIFNLVLFEAGRSYVRTIQSVGRGLRKADDKSFVLITDVTSSLKFSKRHLSKRKEYYKEAGYPFEIFKANYR